jgi:hypothetical protein
MHIRQGKSATSRDNVRIGSRLWTPISVIKIIQQIYRQKNISNFIVISDDFYLMLQTLSLSSLNENSNIHVATTANEIPHPTDENDCVRELGCNSTTGLAASARASIVDMILISRTDVLVGSFRSSYSRVKRHTLLFL